MFCNQCEQTSQGIGCSLYGVCGKSPEVAVLQDLLIYSLKGISFYYLEAQKYGVVDDKIDLFIVESLFSTLTNVNFDPMRFSELINQSIKIRDNLRTIIKSAGGKVDFIEDATNFRPASNIEGLIKQGEKVGLKADVSSNPDVQSLHQMILFGIKGISAYYYHTLTLGNKDKDIVSFINRALNTILNPNLTINDLLGFVLECGKNNLRAMELLDKAHNEIFGHPGPVKVPLGTKKGKAILVSGHDLEDLKEILKQSQGKGIYIYTHGEMLPAHGYPELKKYSHFFGHYGTAWQNQKKEFSDFPGAIIVTTNCLQSPQSTYKDNIFTTGPVGWPDTKHIQEKNFKPVIEKALEMPGFTEDIHQKFVMVGFGHYTFNNIADKIVNAVKNKEIRHFFLVAGCDGAKIGRNYYTELVEKIPKDCVILTLACGKFRFFDKELGNILGLPRIIDIGQCNDAYSAIQIALLMASAFNIDVNMLPLSMILSWYEQKAVAILLTLLYLGIKNIRLGPSLPAFISPNILKILSEKFDIKPITTPDEDLKAILGNYSSG